MGVGGGVGEGEGWAYLPPSFGLAPGFQTLHLSGEGKGEGAPLSKVAHAHME